ncbi:MAG: NADAR family protein [Planctomycetes bacterium]|nr:NADAR family protein [Planctomycetota bacterium]
MSDPKPQTVIEFYSTTGEYGCFSNFSRHSIFLKKKRWPTTEHYFQAQKVV